MAIAPGDPRDQPTVGVALLDVSTGEFTATEYAGADEPADAVRRAGGARAARNHPARRRPVVRRGRRRARAGRALADDRGNGPADHAASTPGRSMARRHAARCWNSCTPAVSKGFGLDRHPAAVCGGGRAHPLSASHAKSRPRACPVDCVSPAGRCPAHRSDDAQASGDRRGFGRRSAGSLLDELDRTITSMASRLLRSWLLRPLLTLDADPRSPGRGRGARVSRHRTRQVP